jgi:hypothetical protein
VKEVHFATNHTITAGDIPSLRSKIQAVKVVSNPKVVRHAISKFVTHKPYFPAVWGLRISNRATCSAPSKCLHKHVHFSDTFFIILLLLFLMALQPFGLALTAFSVSLSYTV